MSTNLLCTIHFFCLCLLQHPPACGLAYTRHLNLEGSSDNLLIATHTPNNPQLLIFKVRDTLVLYVYLCCEYIRIYVYVYLELHCQVSYELGLYSSLSTRQPFSS